MMTWEIKRLDQYPWITGFYIARVPQTLNVKNYTEVELVGTSNYVPYKLWLIILMGEQEYPVKDNALYQDNQSKIRMLKSGRNSYQVFLR